MAVNHQPELRSGAVNAAELTQRASQFVSMLSEALEAVSAHLEATPTHQ